MTTGGPVVMVWGWVLNSAFILIVVAYMGEMCSMHPAVGSVYYWSSIYAPSDKWAPPITYICGWFNLLGNFTYDASTAFGMAQYLSACVNLMSTTGTELPLAVQVAVSIIVIMFWSFKNMLSVQNQGALSIVFALIMGVSSIIIPLVLVLYSNSLSNTDYVNETGFDDSKGSALAYVVIIGGLMTPIAMVGYEGAATLSEETI